MTAKKTYYKKLLLILITLVTILTPSSAKNNEEMARNILFKALDRVENPGGAQLSYHLKVSFYHKAGWIVFKGKKFKRSSRKTIDWYDGVTFWSMDKNSRELTIKKPKKKTDDDAAVTSQIQMVKTGCRYSMKESGNSYLINVDATEKGTAIKHAIIKVNKDSYAPEQVKVKFGPIWATINISNFKTGNYANSNFVYEKEKYPASEVIDKR